MKSVEAWIADGKKMMESRARRIDRAAGWKFDTIATHGLYDFEQAVKYNSGSIMEPVYMSPAQAYTDSAEMEAALSYQMPTWCYSRIANPTNLFLEDTMALLESYGTGVEASTLATSSGMSAIRTATDPFLVQDDSLPPANIVACSRVYGGTFQQFRVRRHDEQGIEVRWVKNPLDINEWKNHVDEGTRFVYGEFPSNPSVFIFDIQKVSEIAHSFGIPLIVDSTCASPALTRPLAHGADIVIHSGSKVLSGSGTSIAGFIIARKDLTSKLGSDEMKSDFAVWAKLWPYRDNGPSLHPMAAFLTLNDLRSLRMRVAQMSRSAQAVAEFLENHPKVDRALYPGLPSYPAYDLAKKYMKLADSDEHLFGYMLMVEIGEKQTGDSVNSRIFYDHLDMIWRATDLGRVKTIATLNAISTHQQQGEEGRKLAGINPNVVRISVGIEDPQDIIADLEKALAAIPS